MDEEQGIAWHPAFFAAIRAELADYQDVLDFRAEHQLSTEPLRIDVLIIKKRRDVVIEKNIGRIFRRDNIIEYKSPEDTLSVEDFYKVYAYACIYRAQEKDAEITDMSLSFMVRSYPRKLIEHLRTVFGYGVKAAENCPGIYEISGSVLPMQIVDSRKLSADENLWLRHMSNDLRLDALREVVRQLRARAGKIGNMSAYLYAVLTANAEATKEGVKQMNAELIEAIESTGLGEKWRRQGWEEGIERGIERGKAEGVREHAQITARNALQMGLSIQDTARLTGLTENEIKALV